ncbi:MAG: glucosamine-6-phosphate deaminase [Planctomycetota bacterium]|nr:glucosamine-6-phosphate deaminase [Planctomycetota bacterium]
MTYPQQSSNGPERIPTQVFTAAHEATMAVANAIADLIRLKASQNAMCVLGLATGSTPMSVYNELVRMHRQDALSFANVVCFNLDEYYPMQPRELQSYVRFMREHLFDHIDIKPENVHIPDGTVALSEVQAYCDSYEQAIAAAGGIDLQLLGIGRTGHIGFNEPGSARTSRTRVITLDRLTRRDAAADFFGEDYVPRRGVTMGVATILEAKQILLLAFGENKSAVLSHAIEGPVTESIPASFLQQHGNTRILLDEAAAADLTRYHSPWLVNPVVHWDAATVRKAVIWLAQKLKKPILKLTVADYNENSLQDMLAEQGSAYDINIRVFRSLQQTITGWPGGKPGSARQAGDVPKPRDKVFPKRVLVFSPHPDDDVISMGGTLIRLASQGHETHVAYQTSGGIAVFDHCALRFADFAVAFNRLFGIDHARTAQLEQHIEQFLRHKMPGQVDSPEIQQLKAMIRRGEARSAGRLCGLKLENLHFLDMPFYDTGTVVKRQLSDADIQLIVDLMEQVQPHQIYAAGDLSDPHGTHRVCLRAIELALGRCKNSPWLADGELWLYRGAWQEWEPDCVDMAVPLSPEELLCKRNAIFRHESQKDRALFPGSDDREFWQRAEARNRRTAVLYDELGLSEYEAIEAFRRWTPKLV